MRAIQAVVSAPDLTGVWMIDNPPKSLGPADGSAVPLSERGRMQYEHNKAQRAKGDMSFDLAVTRCASLGAVRMMTLPYRLEIFQRPHQVTVLSEWNHLYRLINTREPPKEAPYPMAIGISNGHWDGRTLVVKTTDMTDDTQLYASGLPHSDKLEVSKRFSLQGPGRFQDEVTLHDPVIFSRDWSTVLRYHKMAAGSLEEDICLDRLEAGRPAFPKTLDP
jgi:hypothetical protein